MSTFCLSFIPDPNAGEGGQGICIAFNDGSHTYALAQSGIIPPIRIQALEITVDALAVSITKELSAETLNEMWNGSENSDGTSFVEQLTIPGHFVMRGTGSYGFDISSTIALTMECDITLLLDLDYKNDGVGAANGAVDFAMLLSGSITPIFELEIPDSDPYEIDLSAVFSVDSDFYMVSSIC